MYIHIYTYILTQSFWTGTKVIRRKHIVQPTGFGACSSTCCQWDGEDVPAPWEWSNSHPPVHPVNQTGCHGYIYTIFMTTHTIFTTTHTQSMTPHMLGTKGPRFSRSCTWPSHAWSDLVPDRGCSHDQHDSLLQFKMFYSLKLSYWLPDHCRSFPNRVIFQDASVVTTSWADPAILHDFSDRRDRDLHIGKVWPGLYWDVHVMPLHELTG